MEDLSIICGRFDETNKLSFKDRGTVARVKHDKNYKDVHWLYTVKNFRAFGCQAIAFNGKNIFFH